MRVMVTGAAGQLGASFVHRFRAAHQVAAFTRRELDISDRDATALAVRAVKPEVIINCAAYNNVDGAEDDPAAAISANGLGVLSLARGAAAAGALLIHYSSDFVFDGHATEPYVETDPTHPLGVYGLSKLLGEWLAADAAAYILRVESLFGGHPAKSSVDRIVDALRRGAPVRVFSDRMVTPSYVDDVVTATEAILRTRPDPGVYHCVNTGQVTWLGLAAEAARLMGRAGDLQPVPVASVAFRASRPQYCALSNQKLRDVGIEMPRWQEALARHLSLTADSQRPTPNS